MPNAVCAMDLDRLGIISLNNACSLSMYVVPDLVELPSSSLTPRIHNMISETEWDLNGNA